MTAGVYEFKRLYVRRVWLDIFFFLIMFFSCSSNLHKVQPVSILRVSVLSVYCHVTCYGSRDTGNKWSTKITVETTIIHVYRM